MSTSFMKNRVGQSIFKFNPVRWSSCEATKRIELLGLPKEELKVELLNRITDLPNYVPNIVHKWIYVKGVKDFSHMTDLNKTTRQKLEDNFIISYPKIENPLISSDGTMKCLFPLKTSGKVETVLIPDNLRRTLCVSSQVGCSLNCKFCFTGTQKLLRNLKSSEIVGQFMSFATRLKYFPVEVIKKKPISNIVFMGQGEPLYNYKNVSKAIKILTDTSGLSFPKHRVTVSTSGVVPLIPKLATELGISLAVSLHATNNDTRSRLVPLNLQYNIATLMEACNEFSRLATPSTSRITFEYVMLKDVNDSLSEAKELAKLLKHIPSHVNLIPFNPWPGSEFECSDLDKILQFAKIVTDNGVMATVRYSKGLDIMAACGQLKSLDMDKASFKPNPLTL